MSGDVLEDHVRMDPAIPAMAELLDPAAMCRVFERHVWPNAPAIDNCRIERLRYRPGDRFVVRYVVDVQPIPSEAPREHWVTAIAYGAGGRAERNASKGKAQVLVPELDVTLDVFPFDAKLTQSVEVMDGTDPELRRHVLRAFGPGEWTIRRWQVDPVRYRERLSIVVRYRVTAERLGKSGDVEKVFYLKAYTTETGARQAYDHIDSLAMHSRGHAAAFHVDRPIALLASLRAVLFASAAGRPLGGLIESGTRSDRLSYLRQTARALARFNLSDAPLVRRVSTEDYARTLERPASIVTWANDSLRPMVHRVQAVIRQLDSTSALRPTHRDMKVEHVFIDSTRLTAIDLDSAALADPVMDVALLSARLFATGVRGDRPVEEAKELARAFTEEYFAAVPGDWRSRFGAYYAASLLEVAASLIHRQLPGWYNHAAELVRTADAFAASAEVSASVGLV